MQHYRQGDNRKEARLKKIASEINWDEVTGKDWLGFLFTFSLNNDGSIHVVSEDDIDNDFDAEKILRHIDIFDANGRMISNHKDFK